MKEVLLVTSERTGVCAGNMVNRHPNVNDENDVE